MPTQSDRVLKVPAEVYDTLYDLAQEAGLPMRQFMSVVVQRLGAYEQLRGAPGQGGRAAGGAPLPNDQVVQLNHRIEGLEEQVSMVRSVIDDLEGDLCEEGGVHQWRPLNQDDRGELAAMHAGHLAVCHKCGDLLPDGDEQEEDEDKGGKSGHAGGRSGSGRGHRKGR